MARLCICNGTAVHTAVHCSESARLCCAVLMLAMSVPVLSDSTTCQLLCDYVPLANDGEGAFEAHL